MSMLRSHSTSVRMLTPMRKPMAMSVTCICYVVVLVYDVVYACANEDVYVHGYVDA